MTIPSLALKILRNKCTGCGLCASLCPTSTLEMNQQEVVIARPEYCVKCGHCGSICPAGAIIQSATETKSYPTPSLAELPSTQSLLKLFRSRRSVRQYKAKAITKKDMNTILEAGRYTATGSNSQNIGYIVITDPEKISELRELTLPSTVKLFGLIGKFTSLPFASYVLGEGLAYRMRELYVPGMELFNQRCQQGEDRLFYNAPAIIMVHAERFDETSAFSCAAALYNCSLAAHTLGIGCCFNGFLQTAVNTNKDLKNWFGLPFSQKCYGAMTLGYQGVKYNRLVKRNPPSVKWI